MSKRIIAVWVLVGVITLSIATCTLARTPQIPKGKEPDHIPVAPVP